MFHRSTTSSASTMNKNKNNSASLISGNATKAGAKINPITKKNKDSVETKNGKKI